MHYFRWEGTRRGEFCEGVIEAPLLRDGSADCMSLRLRARGITFVCSYEISAERACELWEHERETERRAVERREQLVQEADMSKRARWRTIARVARGTIGLAGCSAAVFLLPLPVAIWAASAFAALTVAAAAPP